MSHHAADALRELTDLLGQLDDFAAETDAVAPRLIEVLRSGGTLFTCGNGGSASDALHMAEECVGRYKGDRPSLAAICLCADVTALTCIANDYGYDHIFSRQVEGLGKLGDALIAFSTSGNSANIVNALRVARERGLLTILVGGKTGGPAALEAKINLIVPSETTARIQEVHTLVLHSWLEAIEAEDWS